MHQALKPEIFLLAGVAALSIIPWVVAPNVPEAWLLRTVLSGGIAISGALAALWLHRREQQDQAARRVILSMCASDNSAAAQGSKVGALSSLSGRNAWRTIIVSLQERLRHDQERLQLAEQFKARAEVRLRRLAIEREQLAEVLSGIPDPVLAIDNFDDLVLANASAERLFAIKSGPAEQRAVESLLQCQELVELLTQTRRRKTPSQRSSELALADETGETHWYRVTCRSLANAGDSSKAEGSRGAVAVLSDISPQKAIQKRNAEFVSAVSHEMKAPLSGIKAYVELLADGDAEDEATREEFLGVINGQADRLQRLIDNLLNLARIEAGVVNVQKASHSLNALLEEALDVVQPSAESKRIELCRDLSPLYLGVLADRDMLLQAAINLLSNAIKYTPEGGQVTLRSRLTDGETSFEVQDTGVGLSPEDAQRVFDKFYRVKKDSQMASGTGLGLPLAKHIVEDVHGGRLTVESEPERGSTFRVSLPAPEKRSANSTARQA